MYDECENYLIPKTKYYIMVSDLKIASDDPHKHVRQNYYLLSKYEILLCGDVEKIIKKSRFQCTASILCDHRGYI